MVSFRQKNCIFGLLTTHASRRHLQIRIPTPLMVSTSGPRYFSNAQNSDFSARWQLGSLLSFSTQPDFFSLRAYCWLYNVGLSGSPVATQSKVQRLKWL
ncbi:uncharacterized protein LOC8277702 isoform X1 [Ricinus communis]|uniref:uncharacterized protein LOC8277702 isoform X1 n=1 Tax=Ricinus communis TaxID=3988 RepID=UPI0007728F86|nr:uncharacterized protein LOC8277702 isoform X1 [Ricinus communis]|eukprot:XP_015572697.1 uncharacterized protein LOC8277702 isoform X2 [Ricinus communis]